MNGATSPRTAGWPAAMLGEVRGILRQHPLLSYFALAYGLAWLVEIPFLQLSTVPAPLSLQLAAFLGPPCGPALAAFLVVGAAEGKAGVLRLLRGYTIWRVGVRWYAFALLGIPLIIVAGALVLPGVLPSVSAHAPVTTIVSHYLVALLIFGVIGGPFLEEFGWRGFALPRLQCRYGPLLASLLLGVFWTFWHLPFFLPGGFSPHGMSVLQVKRGEARRYAARVIRGVNEALDIRMSGAPWYVHAVVDASPYL